MSSPDRIYTVDHNIFLSDETVSKVLENDITDNVRVVRVAGSKLNAGVKAWTVPDSIGATDSFVSEGTYDNHSKESGNYLRWQTLMAQLEKIRAEYIPVTESGIEKIIGTGDIYTKNTQMLMVFQPRPQTLKIAFRPRNNVLPAKPTFTSVFPEANNFGSSFVSGDLLLGEAFTYCGDCSGKGKSTTSQYWTGNYCAYGSAGCGTGGYLLGWIESSKVARNFPIYFIYKAVGNNLAVLLAGEDGNSAGQISINYPDGTSHAITFTNYMISVSEPAADGSFYAGDHAGNIYPCSITTKSCGAAVTPFGTVYINDFIFDGTQLLVALGDGNIGQCDIALENCAYASGWTKISGGIIAFAKDRSNGNWAFNTNLGELYSCPPGSFDCRLIYPAHTLKTNQNTSLAFAGGNLYFLVEERHLCYFPDPTSLNYVLVPESFTFNMTTVDYDCAQNMASDGNNVYLNGIGAGNITYLYMCNQGGCQEQESKMGDDLKYGNFYLTAIGVVAPPLAEYFFVGGSVNEQTSGKVSLQLQLNSAETITVSDGPYKFNTQLPNGSHYNMTIATQPYEMNPPVNEICEPSSASGIIHGNDITIPVFCGHCFNVGGTVSGLLPGNTIVLQNNNDDNLAISSNGTFKFATPVMHTHTYNVTVFTQPSGQTCTVSSGSGMIDNADITNVSVNCLDGYSVGGTISGLMGNAIVLQNNGSDNLSVSSDGDFTFPTGLKNGSAYNVTIYDQPPGAECDVLNASGTIQSTNITNVLVECQYYFSFGGTISGLSSGGKGTLWCNLDEYDFNSNGSFTCPQTVLENQYYEVGVSVQPDRQTCTVQNGEGNMPHKNVDDIVVSCTDN
ncbi:MAG: hypothetical protein WC889_07780 [Myxococcota bacterium]|jgi:hypothetical protein